MSHICDRAIEISLRVDVRFGPESEQDRVATQYVANGMDRPRSRPQQLSEWVGACQEQEHRHAEQVHRSRSRHHRLIWVRTHFTWSASICTVPSCCERRSRVDASYRGLRTCHPASLASKREWQRTTLHVSLRRLAMM